MKRKKEKKKKGKSAWAIFKGMKLRNKIALGIWVFLFFLVSSGKNASAQIPIPNGQPLSNLCAEWAISGFNDCVVNPASSNGFQGQPYLTLRGIAESPIIVVSSDSDIIALSVPFYYRKPSGSNNVFQARIYDSTSTRITTETLSVSSGPTDWTLGTLDFEWPENAAGFDIIISNNRAVGDNMEIGQIGPFTGTTVGGILGGDNGETTEGITVVIDNSPIGDTDGDGDLTLSDLSGLEDITSELGDLFSTIDNFDCNNPAATGGLGGLSSLVGGSGGGGLGALIKAVFNIVKTQLKLNESGLITNCELALSNLQTGAILQRLSEPNSIATPEIRAEIADIMANPAAGIAIDSALNGQSNQGDDQVTAANRTNNLLVANMRLQAQLSDRLLGTQQRPAYQLEGGPLLNADDVVTDDGAEFPEGDYVGTRENLRSRLSEQGVTGPEYQDFDELIPEIEFESGNLSCISQLTPPADANGDGVAALEILKWNLANEVAKSNFGDFLCQITTQPARFVQELCLGPAQGIVINNSAVALTLVEPNAMCVYGPRAPSFLTILLDALGSVTLIFAAVAVFKMYFA